MAATRIYSTAAYWVAAAVAIGLSLCPKVGAAISAIPPGVLGGATVVLYGLVGVLGVRIWLTNGVDFAKPLNQMTAAIPLIIGIADFTWHLGTLTFTGIALGSIAALLVYHGMRLLGLRATNTAAEDPSPVEPDVRPARAGPAAVTAARRRTHHSHRSKRPCECRTRPTSMGGIRRNPSWRGLDDARGASRAGLS